MYRPLVYNFLDNKFGKRLSFALVPFYILIALATSLNYNVSNYFGTDMTSNDFVANNNNYEDLLNKGNGFINNVSIQSKVISDNYMKIFVLFSENIEDNIFSFNPDLKPEKDSRGLKSNISFSNNFQSNRKRDSLRRVYLKTFNDIYSVKIDTIKYNTDFILANSINEKLGFETYVSTKALEDGKHLLKVDRLRIRNGDTTTRNVSKIPFWHYRN